MMARLFISYSRADKNFAIRLKNSLQAVGAYVWIDLKDIEAGVKWSTAVQQGLRQSDLMLLILSPDAVASKNVEDEWQYFLDEGKPIIPLYWRQCEPHFQLRRLQYIDFRPAANSYDEAFNQLLNILKSKGVSFDRPSVTPVKPTLPASTQSKPVEKTAVLDKPMQRFGFLGDSRWQGIGAIIGIAALVFAIYTFVLKDGEEEDDPSTPTITQVAVLLTEEATEIPTDSPTERPSITPTRTRTPTATPTPTATLELLTQIAMEFTQTKIAGDAFASATAAQWTYTPSNTPTPTATFTPTPDYTQTYEKARDDFAASLTAESWTDTPTPTFTPTLTEREKVLKRAKEGVSSNNEWTPYVEEIHGVEMVLVPKGCFMMGSEDGNSDEKPVYEQCFGEPFWIDRTEVTRAMYQRCVKAGACETVVSNQYSVDGNQPINFVSWFQARDYCTWRGARLPTEREWEYAARGPDNLIYPWGNEFVEENVVYEGNAGDQTAPVGSRPKGSSWIGALDMSGNVWEWVSSLYEVYPYTDQWESNNDTASVRGLRGGSWYLNDYDVRAANRDGSNPINESSLIGFRCARSYEGG